MRLCFLGAAGEVTGSCTLVETGDTRFLVDCGMFQGGPEARTKNLHALNFGFDVRKIDFVLLTHAHIDHCIGSHSGHLLCRWRPLHATAEASP